MELENLMEQYADENGCISRDSMRRALEANLGSEVSEADVDRVMSRLGSDESHGGSRRVSLIEADVAIKAFRKSAVSPSACMERGIDIGDFEMAARCDEAEVRAIGAEAALAATEEQLTEVMSERDYLRAENENLKEQRESDGSMNCYALEELQAELHDALEEVDHEHHARERDARRLELMVAEIDELKQNAAMTVDQNAHCAQLEADALKTTQVVAQNLELQTSLKEAQSEIELLVQRVTQQDEQNRSVSDQLKRYQELLNDTQTTLQNQRSIVETLHEAIDNKAMLSNEQNQGSLAVELAAQNQLAELDILAKEVSSLSTALKRQEEQRQQEREQEQLNTPKAKDNNSAGLGFSTEDLMAQLKATIKSELQSELSQMRDVFTPTGTPNCTPKHTNSVSSSATVGTNISNNNRPVIAPSTLKFTMTTESGLVQWKPARELLDLEYQFQDRAEQMTDQAASISNYLGRLQKACDSFSKKLDDKNSSLSPRSSSESNFLQAVNKLLLKMKRSEGKMRDCLQSLFGEDDQITVDREPDIWTRRCKPPLYLLALQKELLTGKIAETEKIKRLSKEKDEAIERNACEWKRAIRKAAKRINRDPETPVSINERPQLSHELEIENIPPMPLPLLDKFSIQPVVEQLAEC